MTPTSSCRRSSGADHRPRSPPPHAAARREALTLYSSAALIAELEQVLARPKLAERLARVGSSGAEIVGDYRALVHWARPTAVPRVVRDPDDDQVIACALAAKAELIVSGDADLITLREYQGIPIVTAAQLLAQLRTAAEPQ